MKKLFKSVKCRSGVKGTQIRLRDNYGNDYSTWEAYAEMYGLHTKIGFKTPQNAWRANPVIQSSIIPSDYCKIVNGRRVFHDEV